MSKITVLLLLAVVAIAPANAQTDADRDAIRRVALDYIDGWYGGDAARMERALHAELAKRMVYTEPGGQSRLDHQGMAILVRNTNTGGGRNTPEGARRNDVTILDVFENAASVKVDAAGWVDYLHVARWNGEWKIVNVLWELRPRRE